MSEALHSYTLLATGGYDRIIRLWDAASGKNLKCFTFNPPGLNAPQVPNVNTLYITKNKSKLLAGGYAALHMFDIASSSTNAVATLDGHVGNVTQVDVEPHQRWIYSSSEDRTVRLWDSSTLKSLKRLVHPHGVNTVALRPSHTNEMVTGDMDGHVIVWDISTDKHLKTIDLFDQSGVRSLSFTPDGDYLLAVSNTGDMRIFNIKSDATYFHEILREKVGSPYCLSACISPDGHYMASAGSDGIVRTWTFNPDQNPDDDGVVPPILAPKFVLKAHSNWCWECKLSADGAYLVSCSSDTTARLWDLTAPPPEGLAIRHYTGHPKAVTCLALRDEAVVVNGQ
ncbi:WD domain, G-beta repeat [Carpediemonas membranifera]|uniref:Target of rapamycin complex subunit LST8 n=1 Tax=Carpediemonas membranifera TaxID=201153 RepID=A0A8J6E852_9EUKA|nr:WD domain, G-beta repeat [Carpediemonas membranifera]|eukprot:KAG9391435.1 WD domain, G-beta repeat [Carpediemonas membranifera]